MKTGSRVAVDRRNSASSFKWSTSNWVRGTISGRHDRFPTPQRARTIGLTDFNCNRTGHEIFIERVADFRRRRFFSPRAARSRATKQQVRALVDAVETAAEARDASDVLEHVADNYADSAGL